MSMVMARSLLSRQSINNTNKTFLFVVLMVLVAFTGCRYDKDFTCTSVSPDDCIVAGLRKLNVDDLLSFHTNVSTAVASTNLGVAVARELKRRYDWIKVYGQPWEFDGCRHTLIHICDGDNNGYRCFDTVYDKEHNGDYPFAEIHARTYELSKHWGYSVYVSFRQGYKWIIDWEKSTTRQPIFVRKEDK